MAKLVQRWLSNDTVDRVSFWTLGTNLKDTPPNRVTIEEYWQRFRKIMNKYTEWGPLFRVVETGTKGKRLHLHILVQDYVEREYVLKVWVRITKLPKPHVWLGEVRNKYVNIVRTLWYASKYVSKEATTYSWLGEFYGKYSQDKEEDLDSNGPEWKFWNIVRGQEEGSQTTLNGEFIATSIRYNYRKTVWEVKY